MTILHPTVPTEAPELVHQKSLRIMLVDKGISVVYRWPKNQTKPAKVTVKVTLKHNPRPHPEEAEEHYQQQSVPAGPAPGCSTPCLPPLPRRVVVVNLFQAALTCLSFAAFLSLIYIFDFTPLKTTQHLCLVK